VAKRSVFARGAGVMRRLVVDEHYRNAAMMRVLRPANLFQPDNHTEPDRYPELFALATREVADGPDRRLLSFGCSTGEEVFALRSYFPTAEITGVDINPGNIAVCRRRLAARPDPSIHFRVARGAESGADRYDAIFCMAVFRHGRLADLKSERCDRLIRFADFERTTAGLARTLKAGGLLVIEHANFRFRDTCAFGNFEILPFARTEPPDDRTPLYGPDNRLLPGAIAEAWAFRKRV
jgi:2-polyprenyl-3-methyl-5-hydroxy-6-metoxy-1,4-benzoquinol methylase